MENKGLYRSGENKVIGGVCGGIAGYLQVDPVIVRLLCVLIFFLSGPVMFLIYLVLMFIMPKQEPEWKANAVDQDNPVEKSTGNRSNVLFGILLITIGVIFLFDQYFRWIQWRKLWPVVLIILGFYLLLVKPSEENAGEDIFLNDDKDSFQNNTEK